MLRLVGLREGRSPEVSRAAGMVGSRAAAEARRNKQRSPERQGLKSSRLACQAQGEGRGAPRGRVLATADLHPTSRGAGESRRLR